MKKEPYLSQKKPKRTLSEYNQKWCMLEKSCLNLLHIQKLPCDTKKYQKWITKIHDFKKETHILIVK